MLKYTLISLLFSAHLFAEINAIPLKKALKNGIDPNAAYTQINKDWRDLVDKTPDKIIGIKFFSQSEKSKLLDDKELNDHFENLIKIGKIRSRYINYLYNGDGSFIQDNLDNGLISDVRREVQIIPMKWLANASLFLIDIKSNFTSGYSGIKKLTKNIIELILVFILPFFSIWLVKKLINYFKDQALTFKAQRYKSKDLYRKYNVYKALKKYAQWPLYYLVFRFFQNRFNETYAFLFSIAELFALYKFFLLLTKNLLNSLLSKDSENNKQPTSDAKLIARLVFVSYFFLLFSENIVGTGISFFLLKEGTFWALILVSTLVIAKWNKELAVIISKYEGGVFAIKFSDLLKRKRYFFLALPALVCIILVRSFNFILAFLERFDIFKQISAQIFKKKLESSEKFEETDLKKLPEDYIEIFEPIDRDLNKTEFINSNHELYKEIKDEISVWLENPKEENSLAIYGDKGCGKSTLLDHLTKNLELDVKIISIDIHKRLSKAEDLLREIGSYLDIELNESFAPLIQKDKELKKTLFVMDSCQNIFLSQMGGFGAYKAFAELINLRLENIFWISAFNGSSWHFLKTVFRDNQCFRLEREVKPWTEDNIKSLIINRHKQMDYRLSFDRILKAIQGRFDQESLDNAEELFFRILWEQSSGNPRVALYLWLSSLSFNGNDLFNVGLPHGDELSFLGRIGDEPLFVYSSILRHENLSAKEATYVTSLNESVVRYALKLGLENNFLIRRDNGQYTFNTRFQYTLTRFLKKKNLILGK